MYPAKSSITITTTHHLAISIYDSFGRVQMEREAQKGTQRIDISHLENGLYIISGLDNESQKIYTEKMLKI